MNNKTIYMTYKKDVPKIVFDRWERLNPNYTIDFSLDNDCIDFLRSNFNDYIAELFITIPTGMYKADLWRLCKLYINGGVYADVDLVPYIDIDNFLQNCPFADKNLDSFYTCKSVFGKSIFQAFMICKFEPKHPLILQFIISFIINKAYNFVAGPTIDMYKCLEYNIDGKLQANIKYNINQSKIKINVDLSLTANKEINLHYFPSDISYTINIYNILPNDIYKNVNDEFNCNIKDNILYVNNIKNIGWTNNYFCDICIQIPKTINIFLFKEYIQNRNIAYAYIAYKNKKLLNCRDINYYNNGGW